MKRFFSLIPVLVLFITTTASAATSSSLPDLPPSAKRHPSESFASIAARVVEVLGKKRGSHWSTGQQAGPASAFAARVPMKNIDIVKVPEWTKRSELQKAFETVRDERFMPDADHPGFQRRMSWLYPDDGCFARAELFSQKLIEYGYPKPAKVFAFGDLSVWTQNSPMGMVSWWYHVVVGYRVGTEIFVFDPAITAEHPLPLKEWVRLMNVKADEVTISVCDSNSDDPYGPCVGSPEKTRDQAISRQSLFFGSEWNRVEILGDDPMKVLGDEPPWVNGKSRTTAKRNARAQ